MRQPVIAMNSPMMAIREIAVVALSRERLSALALVRRSSFPRRRCNDSSLRLVLIALYPFAQYSLLATDIATNHLESVAALSTILPMNTHDTDDNDFTELEPKSKSQRKRAAEAAQRLGLTLVEMPATRFKAMLAKLDLPDNLREALTACRAITAHGGRRRQLQYIGKLMRDINTAPIQQTNAAHKDKDHTSNAAQHRLERWRERLIAEGDVALGELLNEYPGAARQQLRQLITKARKERDAGLPPAAARVLFQELRGLMAAQDNDIRNGAGT